MINIGAAIASTAGYGQVQAYINTFDGRIDTRTAGRVQACFGIGNTVSTGSIDINSPIGTITFHVVNADTLFLLCLQDIDRLGVYFNNLTDTIVTAENSKIKVVRLFNHPFLV